MTNATLRGKPDAGNPHVRFDEGEVASTKPRRGSLLYTRTFVRLMRGVSLCLFALGVFATAPVYGYWGHTDPIIGDGDIQKTWSYETWNWMGGLSGTNVLGDITMMSSHDAGMNEDLNEQGYTITVAYATQYHSIYEQLKFGCRFFDVRVKKNKNNNDVYQAAHGGDSPGWEYGHPMKDIFDDSVKFLTENPSETVILKFSHWYKEEEMLEALGIIYSSENASWTNRFYRSDAEVPPLLNHVTLDEVRGKIVFLLDRWADNINDEPVNALDDDMMKSRGYTPGAGVWRFGDVAFGSVGTNGYYRIYDKYADDYRYDVMLSDQRKKWKDFLDEYDVRTDGFMLCWQLTYHFLDGVFGGAVAINPELNEKLGNLIDWGFKNRPNFVNIDYIDHNICRTAINANYELFHRIDRTPVTYLAPLFGPHGAVTNYEKRVCRDYRVLGGTVVWTLDFDDDRWYVTDVGGCSLNKGADVAENCHARIILRDGTLLWSFHEDFDKGPSIDVEKTGAALTIYGQSTSTNVMGRLEVQGDEQGAGIGAGNNHDGKRITINGGKVTARGGKYASGIGGGNEGSGYDITINGGWVLAYGGENGAGIGGGRDCDGYDIAINGGRVEAFSGGKSAGIGGGYAGAGHHITINGGYTRVVGKDGGAGIGGGEYHNGGGDGYAIVVNGGTVDADEVYHAYNLGHGNDGPEKDGEVTIMGGSVWANGREKWKGQCWGLRNPTNAVGQAIYEVTVPSVQTAGPVSVSGLGTYGVNDLYAFENKLKFYLPNGTCHFWAGDTRYDVTVNNGTATSQTSAPVNESTTYASQAAAQTAAANAYVARPNDQVVAVVAAEKYDGMFNKKTVQKSANQWVIQPELTTATTNEVTQAINSSAVASNLVSTITNAVPTTRLKTTAGLYYGMAGAGSVQAIGAATPSNWELGDGTEKEISGSRPAGATDKAFYQLRVTTQP